MFSRKTQNFFSQLVFQELSQSIKLRQLFFKVHVLSCFGVSIGGGMRWGEENGENRKKENGRGNDGGRERREEGRIGKYRRDEE